MVYNEINYKDLIKEVDRKKSALLCGNGFSVNFEAEYKLGYLAERLYHTHCHLNSYTSYDIIANQNYKFTVNDNFKETKKLLQLIKNEDDFISYFSDAVQFADSIVNNDAVLLWLNANGYNSKLVFGLAHIDLVYSIVDQAKKHGVMYVNYEYWTVLIYYVLALKNAPSDIYSFDPKNLFVVTVLKGGTNSLLNVPPNGSNIYLDASINGVYTYLRFLFTANILLDGKSVNVTELTHWNTYNIDGIKEFLNKFDELMTTNYDLILENITQRNVGHLHGSYSKEKRRVLAQSLGVFYNLVRYDLSTAVIGDYFLSKSFVQIASQSASKQMQNSMVEIYAQIIDRVIKKRQCEVIVIFGLNVDNDYHILRDIQISLEASNITNPHIIYCFYNDWDKNSFINAYEECITYSEPLCKYVKDHVMVSIMDSKELINYIFTPPKTI